MTEQFDKLFDKIKLEIQNQTNIIKDSTTTTILEKIDERFEVSEDNETLELESGRINKIQEDDIKQMTVKEFLFLLNHNDNSLENRFQFLYNNNEKKAVDNFAVSSVDNNVFQNKNPDFNLENNNEPSFMVPTLKSEPSTSKDLQRDKNILVKSFSYSCKENEDKMFDTPPVFVSTDKSVTEYVPQKKRLGFYLGDNHEESFVSPILKNEPSTSNDFQKYTKNTVKTVDAFAASRSFASTDKTIAEYVPQKRRLDFYSGDINKGSFVPPVMKNEPLTWKDFRKDAKSLSSLVKDHTDTTVDIFTVSSSFSSKEKKSYQKSATEKTS